MQTQDNVVFITGGSSGIGLALAEAFLERENTVIVCGRNAARLEAVRHNHPTIHTIACDISDAGQVQALIEQLKADFGSLNVLFNNAGVQYSYPQFAIAHNIQGQIDGEINTNLTAAVQLTYGLLPHLLQQPQAAIINVSSVLGVVPRSDLPVYCATKAALHTFSQVLRMQLQATPVQVFEIQPPTVDTPMIDRARAKNVISPEALAKDVLHALAKDTHEIHVGIARVLALVNRVSPRLAAYMVHH